LQHYDPPTPPNAVGKLRGVYGKPCISLEKIPSAKVVRTKTPTPPGFEQLYRKYTKEIVAQLYYLKKQDPKVG
jgi:hypothetical protein